MNQIANNIKNRLSLRQPQRESLEILEKLSDILELKKGADLAGELHKVRELYSTCSDFERSFPSLCFALATGVGKTRLMGAFISYLYIAKKIKNFFVLAPNLTVYNKLIKDLSDQSFSKYVFRGIGEFVHKPPVIITGDTYSEHRQYAGSTLEPSININIFNISKINAETRSGKTPRIKRLSEILGDSYFNYLTELDDLVLIMDESHHYRADRGMEVINELNPVLGLELTATPQVERSGGSIKFKNVVYEYSLAKAIRDGFVKEPCVATRKEFDPQQYSIEEMDRIKLEDGIRIHEDTKVALEIYAGDNKVETVKPFVLVVAKDTEHAESLRKIIMSQNFFNGSYMDKVIEIHSNQKGAEKEENITELLSLENPENKTEIVIHVNMLKEGWDVTNLYTIIPLRSSASLTLREQTIGRGLRLPYGKRTDEKKVDKLTIVSHDKFQEIIEAANSQDSIIKLENIINIDDSDLSEKKEVVVSHSSIESILEKNNREIEKIQEPEQKEKAKVSAKATGMIINAFNQLRDEVKSIKDLDKEEVKESVLNKVRKKLESEPQINFLAADNLKEMKASYEEAVRIFTDNIIEIPRIILMQSTQVKAGFCDFDLDVAGLNYQPLSEEIYRKTLRTQENGEDTIKGDYREADETPENIIISELINFPEVDYDEQASLLFRLAGQALAKLKSNFDNDPGKILNVIKYHRMEIGRYIYSQMMKHFYLEAPEYEVPKVHPFIKIEDHNYTKIARDNIYHYTDTIKPADLIPGKIFTGFKKACHDYYKFDSKSEKDFSIILESNISNDVLKWLRPAPNQFSIYWKHNSKRYRPDFVVETNDKIFLVEIKKEKEIDSEEVKMKADAALQYCRHATEFTTQNDGKPWEYLLIPHDQIILNRGFQYFSSYFKRE